MGREQPMSEENGFYNLYRHGFIRRRFLKEAQFKRRCLPKRAEGAQRDRYQLAPIIWRRSALRARASHPVATRPLVTAVDRG
jgi:hypothetical protein